MDYKFWSCFCCNGILLGCCEKMCEGIVEFVDEKDVYLKYWLS